MGFVSIRDVFKIGIGPSSSHTLGALKSGLFFRKEIKKYDLNNSKIKVELCGSFALTGKGHLTDKAVVCGLNGLDVEKEGDRYLLTFKGDMKQMLPKAEVRTEGKRVKSFKLFMKNGDTLEIVKR